MLLYELLGKLNRRVELSWSIVEYGLSTQQIDHINLVIFV